MDALGLSDRKHFAKTYLQPGLGAGLVEMTLPDSPRSRSQRYRLTALGRQVRDSLQTPDVDPLSNHDFAEKPHLGTGRVPAAATLGTRTSSPAPFRVL